MVSQLRAWLQDIPLTDALKRRQAGTLQIMLLVILGGCLFGCLVALLTDGSGNGVGFSLAIYLSVMGCAGSAIALLHRGRFTLAVLIATAGIICAISVALFATGLSGSSPMTIFALGIMVVLAGLLLGRAGIGFGAGMCTMIVVAAGLLEGTPLVGWNPTRAQSAGALIPTFVMLIVILSLFLDRFGNSLRVALAEAQAREQELEALRDTLEHRVSERTAALQASVDQIRADQETIRALGAPILPVLEGVLVAPVIGTLDARRAAHLTDSLLRAVERERAVAVILDVTAIPAIDGEVAQALVSTAAATRLLGATPYLVGVRAEVAQALVALDVSLGMIEVYPSLREAVRALTAAYGRPSEG